jgi:drug/metabolite transporter (DMT)-like permease
VARAASATIALTVLAMVAFAANSLLCRVALRDSHIDPASFGGIRVTAGALVLAVAMRVRSRPAAPVDWRAAAMLFAYVAAFSFAYLTLPAGTGALILFGAVQLTMFAVGLARGERFASRGWAGLALALAGFIVLVLPGVAAPPLGGAMLMAVAGAAWGVYSLRGRGVPDPLAATASNFLRALPLALLLGLMFAARAHADIAGGMLAIASGALTSGLGYVIWYAALRGLSALQAASVQLSVPVIAAVGGTLWLDEVFTARLFVAVVAILGGIGLVLMDRARGRG